MYFDKNTVSKHKNASIKIIKSFILLLASVFYTVNEHTQTVVQQNRLLVFFTQLNQTDMQYSWLAVGLRNGRPRFDSQPCILYIYIKSARVTKSVREPSAVYEYLWALSIRSQTSTFTLQHVLSDQIYQRERSRWSAPIWYILAPDGALQRERSRAGALCGLWILMSSEYSIANFNFYVAAYVLVCPSVRHNVRLSVRPSVRPSVLCQHNLLFQGIDLFVVHL